MSSELNKMLGSYSAATKGVRSTIDAIIEEQSFVELDAFMGGVNELGEIKGEGVVCGLAAVGEHDVALFANNPEVFDGGISAKGAAKIDRLVKRAVDAGLPLIAILDTAGARVLEGIDALDGYSLILDSFAKAYGQIPVITVVKGKNYGMLSYLAGLSDMFVAYDKAKVATASPLIISSSADGKDYSDAKKHFECSGVVTNIVKNNAELKALLVKALDIADDLCDCNSDDPNRVCEGLSEKSSVRDVLKEAFDADSVLELREGYVKEVVTAFARLDGDAVAVVGVDGKLTAKGAVKITDFLNTAENLGIPVINLVNSTGVVVDAHQETCCLMHNISDLIYTYSNLSIPKVAMVCGNAVGAAYSILASRKNSAYTLAWDCAAITPLETTAAARLLYGDDIAKAKDTEKAEAKFAKVYAEENSAFVAAEKGYIDSVLIPNHTRQYLLAALRTVVKR